MIDEDTLKVGDILYNTVSNNYVLITYVKDNQVDDTSRGIFLCVRNGGCFPIKVRSYQLQYGEFRRTTDEEKAFVLLKLEFYGIEIPR